MRVALLTTFAASRKEPLADMLERVHLAIAAGGFGEPNVLFVFLESHLARASSVDRVLRRFPELRPFERNTEPRSGIPSERVLSNRPNLGGGGEIVSFGTLLEVARGVPKSFPFHDVSLHFNIHSFSGGSPPDPRGRRTSARDFHNGFVVDQRTPAVSLGAGGCRCRPFREETS